MPGQRDPSQTVMSVSLHEDLVSAVDDARPAGVTRAQFVREALRSYLEGLGITVEEGITTAPDRVAARRVKYPRNKRARKPKGGGTEV